MLCSILMTRTSAYAFSQSAELSACGLEDIELVAQKLNVRPRKTLGRKPWPSVCVIYY